MDHHRRSQHRTLTSIGSAQKLSRHLWRWLIRHLWLAIALIMAGLGLMAFSGLADEVMEGSLNRFDIVVGNFIRYYSNNTLDVLAAYISILLLWPYILVITLPFLFLLITRERWSAAFITGGILFGTVVIVSLLKLLFERPRPIGGLVEASGYSFPSGHATLGVVVYGLLGYIVWRYMVRSMWARVVVSIISITLALATGLSRIYLEVHYTSDVIAGWAAGTFILFGAIIILEAFYRKWPTRMVKYIRSLRR